MSSLPRALAASAALHVGVLGLFALAPAPRPHRDAPIDVQIVMLPAGGGAGESGASPGGEASDGPGGATRETPVKKAPESATGSAGARVAAAEEVAPRAVPALARSVAGTAPPAAEGDPSEPAITPTEARVDTTPIVTEGDGAGIGEASRPGTGAGEGSGDGKGEGIGDGTGNGSGEGTGDGIGEGSATDDASVQQRLAWHTARCYPRAAQRRRTEGLVEVRFCLDASGNPRTTEVLESSGSDMLDQAATDCVIRSSAPFAVGDVCITAPIEFRLR